MGVDGVMGVGGYWGDGVMGYWGIGVNPVGAGLARVYWGIPNGRLKTRPTQCRVIQD